MQTPRWLGSSSLGSVNSRSCCRIKYVGTIGVKAMAEGRGSLSCLCLAVYVSNSPSFLIKLGYFLSALYPSFSISLFVSFYLFFFSASLVLLPHSGLDDPALGTQICKPSLFACPKNSCQACTLHSRSLLWAWKCCWAKGLGALRINISSHTDFASYDPLPSLGDLLKRSSHVQYEQSLHLLSFSCAQKVWDLLLSIYASFP